MYALTREHYINHSADDVTLSNYRQYAAKRQTAGIKFTRRPKIRFFADSPIASIHTKLGKAARRRAPTWVLLAV